MIDFWVEKMYIFKKIQLKVRGRGVDGGRKN
jgi:hypothetical protein